MLTSFRWAIVAIQTTGLKVTKDKIISIAVTILSEQGIAQTCSMLVNPNQLIAEDISQLGGITNEMVKNASTFSVIAFDLFNMLHECVLVAHNARFAYGFLKNAFKACGFPYQPKVLCTLKLAKQLYPQLVHHDLASLLQTIGINYDGKQRDDNLLVSFLQHTFTAFSKEYILNLAKLIYHQSSKPAKLVTELDTIPASPGVYLFYAEHNDLPIYIGKSICLRQRVMSHFQSDHRHEKEFKMAQQVYRIDYIETAGELSALLVESKLIKQYLPLYNRQLRRQQTIIGLKPVKQQQYLHLEIVTAKSAVNNTELLGAFKSLAAAKNTLRQLVKDHQLCPRLCNIEKSRGACFSYQLHRCLGACVHQEPPELYNHRVTQALARFQRAAWPYDGPLIIKEQHEQKVNWMVFNQWQFLGETAQEDGIAALAKLSLSSVIDKDVYAILNQYFKKMPS